MSILEKNYLSLRVQSGRMDVLSGSGNETSYRSFEVNPRSDWKNPEGLRAFEGLSFEKISCSVDNMYFALVPAGIFDPARAGEYLALSLNRDLKTMVVMYDPVAVVDMVLVYAVEKNMHKALVTAFPPLVFRHYVSICLGYFLRHAPAASKTAYIHICADAFYLVLMSDRQIRVCNRYVFRAPEDILYYLLFAMEQVNMPANDTLLVLGGDIQLHGDVMILLREFFAKVDLDEWTAEKNPGMKYQGAFINQFQCV